MGGGGGVAEDARQRLLLELAAGGGSIVYVVVSRYGSALLPRWLWLLLHLAVALALSLCYGARGISVLSPGWLPALALGVEVDLIAATPRATTIHHFLLLVSTTRTALHPA